MKIIFWSRTGGARAALAVGLARALLDGGADIPVGQMAGRNACPTELCAAGSAPDGKVWPQAVAVLAERGLPTDELYALKPRQLDPALLAGAELLVALTEEPPPLLPESLRVVHWRLKDPRPLEGTYSPERVLSAARRTRNELARRLCEFFEREELLRPDLQLDADGLPGSPPRLPERPRIFLAGATGFIGRSTIRALAALPEAARPSRLACLVRPESPRAGALRGLWDAARRADPALPELELLDGDAAAPESFRDRLAALGRLDVVGNLVGIIHERPAEGITFERLHVEATRNLLAAAREAGARRFVQLSALGTYPGAPSRYHRTKLAAEELVRASGLPRIILRPSVVLGPEDRFANRLAELVRRPVPGLPFALPIFFMPGQGRNKLQPLAVADLAAALARALSQADFPLGEYELGGPEEITFEEFLTLVLARLGRRRLLLHLPLSLLRLVAPLVERLGGAEPAFTRDQLTMLRYHNLCDKNDLPRLLGRPPAGLEATLAGYLR